MSCDLFTLSALAEELNDTLKGARIDKIQQPEQDEIRFFVRTVGRNLCLCISCNSGAPRIHLTNTKKVNPVSAPQFLMLLRKHLSAANIVEIEVFNNDRIVKLEFNARTEMQDNATYYIFFEMMNRYSNIVFTDKDLKILDSVKKLGLDSDRDHVVLRGMTYESVFQPKISYKTIDKSIFASYNGTSAHKFILDNLSGFSGITASELLCRAGIEPSDENITSDKFNNIFNQIGKFKFIRKQDFYQPCIIANKEVYNFPYSVLKGEIQNFDTLSEAFDALYGECDKQIRNKARLKDLISVTKKLVSRTEKNISIDLQKLSECENLEQWKLFGELIVSNIYKIKLGDKFLECVNYYDNTTVKIPLDERYSPSKNSNQYYTKYNKLKRTKEFVEKKLKEDEILLDYAKSILLELESLPYGETSTQIEDELEKLKLINRKSSKNKVRKEKPTDPLEFEIEGFTVYVGKNNIQNETLTFKMAANSDVWMHAKKYHGSHSIIKAQGKDVPKTVLNCVAEILAAQQNASTEIDFTQKKNVKRQPNGHPGQVIYENYSTVIALPNPHKEFLISE